MRILHVYTSPSFSGAEAYSVDLARLQSQTHDVTYFAKAASPLAQHVKSTTSLRLTTTPPDFSNFDVIVLHSTQELKSQWIRILKSRFATNRPKIVVYTHIWISHPKNDPLHAVIYSLVDEIWCSSQGSKATLERLIPISGQKIHVIRYGREIEELKASFPSREEARSKLGVPQDALVIGTLGRIDKGKGSVELLEAVTDLMQTRPDLHLLMIGPPTSSDPKAIALDQKLSETVESLNPSLKKRITKIGRLENGSRYLRAFDLFILATYKENFALTLLEAQLAGVPSLATNSGGSPDLVQPLATGWLFLPGSTDSLRQTLLQALSEQDRWSTFASQAKTRVEAEFSFPSVLRSIDDRMGDLLAHR
ncbi:MAG: glycosyltransferase family 4 protein [Bdellovibrionales bacterium]|nr:glycosyltransferase family 4 protein [Bdellovibrionales bacterium]